MWVISEGCWQTSLKLASGFENSFEPRIASLANPGIGAVGNLLHRDCGMVSRSGTLRHNAYLACPGHAKTERKWQARQIAEALGASLPNQLVGRAV